MPLLRALRRPSPLSVLLYLAGFACLAITAMMNRHAGISQGATEEGRQLLGAGAIAIDIVGLVILGSVAGNLLASHRRWLGGAVLVVVIGCALFSISSIMSFVASEWLSVSASRRTALETAQRTRDAADAAAKERLRLQAELAKQHLKTLETTSIAGGGRQERRDLRKDMNSAAAELIAKVGQAPEAVPPSPAPEIMLRPDGGAEMIAWIMNTPEQTVQVTRMAALAVLLIVIKTFVFPLGAFYWKKDRGPEFLPTPTVPLGEEAKVEIIAPLEPSAGQRMLPAPISRPEPPPEGKVVLARIGFPKAKPEGDARAMTDEERETVGLRLLVWLTAHGQRGDFAQDVLWQIMLEHFEAAGLVPCAERIAKQSLENVHKGRKYYATKGGAPVVWTIRLPDFEELHGLLDKAGFPAAPKAGKAKASPSKQDESVTEEVEPVKGSILASILPFVEAPPAQPNVDERTRKADSRGSKPTKSVKGLAELQRWIPNLEAMRTLGREQKKQFQQRFAVRDRKQSNKHWRSRAA